MNTDIAHNIDRRISIDSVFDQTISIDDYQEITKTTENSVINTPSNIINIDSSPLEDEPRFDNFIKIITHKNRLNGTEIDFEFIIERDGPSQDISSYSCTIPVQAFMNLNHFKKNVAAFIRNHNNLISDLDDRHILDHTIISRGKTVKALIGSIYSSRQLENIYKRWACDSPKVIQFSLQESSKKFNNTEGSLSPQMPIVNQHCPKPVAFPKKQRYSKPHIHQTLRERFPEFSMAPVDFWDCMINDCSDQCSDPSSYVPSITLMCSYFKCCPQSDFYDNSIVNETKASVTFELPLSLIPIASDYIAKLLCRNITDKKHTKSE